MAKSELEIIVGLTDNTKRGLSSIVGSLGKLGKIAAGVALGGVTALAGGLTALAVTSIPAASDLEESINKVNVVFGDASESVHKFAADAATGLGQSQAQALEAAGTYGNLLTSIGLATDQAADMSIEMVTLASDLASFNNASPEETLLALRSALTGEFEPMKRFGTALNQAAVEAKALELGLIKTKDELTPAIKAQAAYALILEQTSNAQGDFARTSEGLANAQRVVKAQMQDLRATIGKFLLPIAEKFFGFLSKTAIPSLKNIIDLFQTGDFKGGIFGLTEDHPFIIFLIEARKTVLDLFTKFKTLVNVIKSFGLDSQTALLAFQDIFGDELGEQVFNVINMLVDGLGKAIAFVVDHWDAFKGALIALGVVFGVIVPLITVIGAVIAALTSPITLIIAAIALLGAAWATNWGGIREKTQAVIDFLLPKILAFVQFIRDFWAEHGDEIIAKAREIWDGIRQRIQDFAAWVVPKVQEFVAAIQQFWADHGDEIMAKAQEIWDAVIGVFEWFKEQWGKIFDAFRLAFEGDWEGFGAKLRELWDEAWEKIKKVASDAWDAIKNIDWAALGRSIIEGIANGVGLAAGLLADAARRAAAAAWEAIKGFFQSDSPSKLMIDFGEKDVMGAWATGITKGAVASTKAMLNAAKTTFASLASGDALSGLNKQLPKMKAALDFGALGGISGAGGMAMAGSTVYGGDTVINQHFYDEGSAALGLALTRKAARDRLNGSMGR